MPKKLGHFCLHISWHISAFSIKLLIIAGLIFTIALTAFVWRVSSDPLDISFAKDYIEASLHDEVTGNSVRMESVVLYWPKLIGPLYLQLHGGQLVKESGEVIISIDMAAISFSRAGLLMGRILPKAIIIKSPTLLLVRDNDGSIKIDLGQEVTKSAHDEQFALTTRIFSYIARPGKQSKGHSLISRLEAFAIDDARLLIDDKIIRQSWSLPDFDLGFYTTPKGMDGYASLALPDVGLDNSSLYINMKYLWDQKNVDISADLKNIDIKAIAANVPELGVFANQNIVLDARIETILDENFIPDDINIDLTSKSGEIIYANLSDNPLAYDNLSLSASYHYVGKSFSLRDTQVTLKGVTVFAKGELTHSDDKANGAVKVWIDDLKHKQIDPLWPKVLRGDISEKWIVKKISDGTFKDVWLGFDLLAEKKLFQDDISFIGPFKPIWSADIDNLKAGFTFENMSVNYRAPLDRVKNAYGRGSFDLNKDEIIIDVDKGNIGAIKVSKAKLLLDQVMVKGSGNIDLMLSLNGHVHDFLHYLSKDPINLDDDINVDIDKVKGDAALDVSLRFPARKDVRIKDFKIGVDGTLKNILLPDIIGELDLSGKSLAFSVKDGLASIKGDAMLESRPIKLEWEEFINSKGKPYKEKIKASINADPNIRGLMGIDLSYFIEGSLLTDIGYVSYNDGRASADITIDAKAAKFFVEPFNFEKPVGANGGVKLTAHLQNGELQKITNLMANGQNFDISKSKILFKGQGDKTLISSGSVSNFILGENKGKLDFIYDEARNVKINMDASFLDIQPFMDKKEERGSYDAPPMKLSVTARQMRTAPSEIIGDAALLFDIDGQGRFNQMEMDAKIGQGNLHLRFKPDSKGKRIFLLSADDAGAFLKAFQLYDDIRGGNIVIYGEPMRGVFDRNLIGKAEISNFKVINAPFLSKLLSMLSLGGITELMSGGGLNFDKLEADFNWLYRRDGSLLVLKNGRTSGNSLGLLFDGTFDNKKNWVDVSGTIAPMSALNGVIGSIPILGDILTGGSGGVFAATYSIKGDSDDPEISVNPLSILTPGILRRILWE